MKSAILFFCSFILSLSLMAQKSQVHIQSDANKILIGDRANVFIVAPLASGESLKWPTIADTFNHLEIESKSKIDTVNQNGIKTLKQKLEITGFDSGLFVIPTFEFQYSSANNSTYSSFTDSLKLEVSTVPIDTTQPYKDYKGIQAVPSHWTDDLGLLSASLIFILLAFLLIYYLIKKRNKKTNPYQNETITEKYLRLLKELEANDWWRKGQVKLYYTELSDLIRNYLEERFNTPALELTTDEILAKTRKHPELKKHQVALNELLHNADMAKFAKAQPTEEEHETALDLVIQFVKKTPQIIINKEPQKPKK